MCCRNGLLNWKHRLERMVFMQRLLIEDFGPIPFCDIELNDFMIFIGEQATGKSTICKCIYFFKSVRDEVKSYLHEIINEGSKPDRKFPNSVNKALKDKFISLFGQSRFKGSFNLKFNYTVNHSLTITTTHDENKYLNFIFSKEMINKIRQLEKKLNKEYCTLNMMKNSTELYLKLERQKTFLVMSQEVNRIFNENREIFYIPAGRGLLSLLTNQLINIELRHLDYITSDFMKLIQRERNKFDDLNLFFHDSSKNSNKKSEQKDKLDSILKGEYLYKDEKEYLRITSNNTPLPINFASSGQQEVLWILNLLNLWMREKRTISVVIEEPEAHLFPNTQKEIIDFIVMFLNTKDNQVLITTHSPYILTATNNLVYAGKVGLTNKKIENIIRSDMWIKPSALSAYIIGESKDMYVKSIMDDELEEIAAEELDQISNKIQNVYSKIFEMEITDEY